MKTFDVFPFRRFDRILVSGPQRSGTRFVSVAIAHDLVLKRHHEPTNPEKTREGVVHCPGYSHCLDKLSNDGTLVVWVKRNTEDVLKSMARIQWEKWEQAEVRKLPKEYHGSPSCEMRYKHWLEVQRPNVEHWVEVDYDRMTDHPLWVSPEDRAAVGGFVSTQTDVKTKGAMLFERDREIVENGGDMKIH